MEFADSNDSYDNKQKKLIPPRDKRLQEIIDLIEIDLPTEEEALFVNKRSTYTLGQHTDLSVLTGGETDFQSFYLNSGYRFDPLAFGHTPDGIGPFKCSVSNRSNKIAIRPVLRFKRCPELWEEIINNHGIHSELYFGMMPTNALSASEQKMINKAFNEGSKELKKENDEGFIFDGVYIYDPKNDMKGFKPIIYPTYRFAHDYDCASKFLIRYKVRQNYKGEDWLDRLVTTSLKIRLSNDEKYKNGNNVWIRISSIPWIVDYEHKTLISKYNLLAGIRYEDIRFYLDNYLKYEMLCHEGEVLDYKRQISVKTNSQEETDEITKILVKIKENMKYYFGDKDIKDNVDKLLENYNNKLDEISNKQTTTLELSIGNENNPKELHKKLINDLQNILSEVTINGTKVKNYHDMIDILNECKKDKIDTNKDELCIIINTIKTVILEFITGKNELKEELDQIITNNINRNESYINEFKNDENTRSRTLDELKLEFRKDLQPFLEKLSNIVERQDLVNEIINNVNIMITNHFTESKNKIVQNYLKILNEIVIRIKEHGIEEEKDTLRKIVQLDFTIDDDTNIIIRKLESMIIKAYKIEFDMEERNNRHKEIDNLKVHIDTSSFFNSNQRK